MSAFFLAFLELTFVMVAIMLLHSMRPAIGKGPFYLTLGTLLVLGQVVNSFGLQIDSGIAGFRVDIGSAVLLSPYLVALLIVYIVEGTVEAQRLILGFLVLMLVYFYLASLTASQCHWPGYSTADAQAIYAVASSFLRGKRFVTASFLAQAVDLFTLPIIFQIFSNRQCRLMVCVLGTLVFAQAIDSAVFQLIVTTDLTYWWEDLSQTYLARLLAMLWLSLLVTAYLRMCQVKPAQDSRRPLDILVAFFGSYANSLRLQKSMQESEERYRLVVESTAELILLLDAEGRILDVNNATRRILESRAKAGMLLPSVVQKQDGTPCNWQALWAKLRQERAPEAHPVPVLQEWMVVRNGDNPVFLEAQLCSGVLNDQPIAIVVARDVTERRRLEQERVQLQDQLIHSQRLEAVGQLAGGVAHDFNNLLHTIQGCLDRLGKTPLSPLQQSLAGNMNTATDRATTLTSQLLGFARRGKYRTERLDLARLLNDTRQLFEPVAGRNIKLKMVLAPQPLYIHGDCTQLQQVFLNLLINAKDAVTEKGGDGRLVLRAEKAAAFTPGWEFRHEEDKDCPADHYVCIRVKDNGTGIPSDILHHIFDPFFTTKPVGKGTGMGLAMAYGCIMNHHGWIHVDSQPGKGTEFFVFLPLAL